MSWIIALILLSILVFVHEMGHLLAGLAVGIKADAFSVGFGPILFRKEIKGIDFRFSAIPFGGYCKFAGETADENGEVASDGFLNLSPMRRIIVYFAGPFFNYLFALFLLTILVSMPSKRELFSPTVSVFKDSRYINNRMGTTLAYEYGIQSGDTILSINGRKVDSDYDITTFLAEEALQKNEKNIVVALDRDNETKEITLPSVEVLKALSGERALGLYFGNDLIIKEVMKDSAAEEAELKAGDKIIAVNGNKAQTIADFRPIIMESPSEKVAITIVRDGVEMIREAIPRPVSSKTIGTYGSLGVSFESTPMRVETIDGVAFPKSIGSAFVETGNYIISYINGLKLLFTGQLSLKENLGGPVRILQISSQVISTEAEYRIRTILSFTATISLILFLMNLLPLPVVDGGMILFAIIELIMRRPIDRAILTKIQAIGAAFLITLAIFITINDITQLFR